MKTKFLNKIYLFFIYIYKQIPQNPNIIPLAIPT